MTTPAMPPGPQGPPIAGYAVPPADFPVMPPALSPGGHRLAEFSDRLVARLIDQAILSGVALVVILPINLIVVLALLGSANPNVNPLAFMLPLLALAGVLILLIIAMSYLYEVELMFHSGQTLGKRVMKIQVIPLDPALTLTRGMAARRFLVQQGCTMIPGLTWVDGLWQLWDKPYRQCLHDKYPSTVVIKLNP